MRTFQLKSGLTVVLITCLFVSLAGMIISSPTALAEGGSSNPPVNPPVPPGDSLTSVDSTSSVTGTDTSIWQTLTDLIIELF